MARSSWLDGEKSVRHYTLVDGRTLVIQNEYQPVECPHCGQSQFQRLTHIWPMNPDGTCKPEYHINRSTDLGALKALPVTYAEPGDSSVCEIEEDGEWFLAVGPERVSRAK